MRNIAYLESVGISGKHVALAHCVHLDDRGVKTSQHQRNKCCSLSLIKFEAGVGDCAGKRNAGGGCVCVPRR